jgi:thiol-disulfide isomerase/thioredoxin
MKLVKSLLTVAVCSGYLVAQGHAAPKLKLEVGDLAPGFTVSSWIKGSPITRCQPGQIYVVDFFATWCRPCNMSMPHLTAVAHKYGAKVQVVGVDVREQDENPQFRPGAAQDTAVANFVRHKGANMDYGVCTDNASHEMMANWMTATGDHGIPCAFVVDRQGRIADIVIGYGGPKDHRLDDTIDQLLAGTFSYKLATAKHKADLKAFH